MITKNQNIEELIEGCTFLHCAQDFLPYIGKKIELWNELSARWIEYDIIYSTNYMLRNDDDTYDSKVCVRTKKMNSKPVEFMGRYPYKIRIIQ